MKKVVRFIIKFVNKATADSVPAYAAQVAFFVMLSFFPFMMLLVMIVSKLSVMNTNVLGYILRVVPSGLESYVAYIVDDVVNANVQSFTLITVFVSLWSAAKGIQALSTGLNKIYGVEQNKNYFLVRLICALYTLVFMVLCIVVIAIQAFGSQIAHKIIDNYPAFADATLLILSLKNVVTFLVIFVFLLLIYYQLPNRRGHMRHEFTGAVLASLAWMLMTRGFSVYIKYSADNSKMYGSMTSVVLIIIWLYIGMQIVLYGAEINYYLSDLIWKYREKYHMKKKAKREEKQKINRKTKSEKIFAVIPKDLKERVIRYKAKTNMSESEIVNVALNEFFKVKILKDDMDDIAELMGKAIDSKLGKKFERMIMLIAKAGK